MESDHAKLFMFRVYILKANVSIFCSVFLISFQGDCVSFYFVFFIFYSGCFFFPIRYLLWTYSTIWLLFLPCRHPPQYFFSLTLYLYSFYRFLHTLPFFFCCIWLPLYKDCVSMYVRLNCVSVYFSFFFFQKSKAI